MTIARQLAFQSVLSNWRHSMATLLSVALGFMAVAAIHGYNFDSEARFEDVYVYRSMTGHVIVEAEQSGEDPLEIEGATADRILAITADMKDEVKSVVRFLRINGIIASSKSSFRYTGYGYDIVQGEVTRGPNWSWNTMFGHPMKPSPTPQIVVGKGLGELLGCPLEGREPKILPDGRYTVSHEKLSCFDDTMQLTGLTAVSYTHLEGFVQSQPYFIHSCQPILHGRMRIVFLKPKRSIAAYIGAKELISSVADLARTEGSFGIASLEGVDQSQAFFARNRMRKLCPAFPFQIHDQLGHLAR